MKKITATISLIIFVLHMLTACNTSNDPTQPGKLLEPETLTPGIVTSTSISPATLTSIPVTPTTLPPTPADYDSLMAYLESHPPTFEDDFSTTNPAWGRTSEFQEIGEQTHQAKVFGGVLTVSENAHDPAGSDPGGYPGRAAEEPGLVFPINGLFVARDFALQYNFKFMSIHNVGVVFRSSSFNYSTISAIDIGYGVNFSNIGGWWLTQRDGTKLASGIWTPRNGFNSILVIVRNYSLIVVINGGVLYSTDELEAPGDSITNGISAMGKDNEVVIFDNVKFWNLDGVQISR